MNSPEQTLANDLTWFVRNTRKSGSEPFNQSFDDARSRSSTIASFSTNKSEFTSTLFSPQESQEVSIDKDQTLLKTRIAKIFEDKTGDKQYIKCEKQIKRYPYDSQHLAIMHGVLRMSQWDKEVSSMELDFNKEVILNTVKETAIELLCNNENSPKTYNDIRNKMEKEFNSDGCTNFEDFLGKLWEMAQCDDWENDRVGSPNCVTL